MKKLKKWLLKVVIVFISANLIYIILIVIFTVSFKPSKVTFKGYYFIVENTKMVNTIGKTVGFDSAMSFTQYPFIFLREDVARNEALKRHERIHIRQEVELSPIGAFLLYAGEYLYGKYILRLGPEQSAYYPAMEQEAHVHDMDTTYLQHRPPWAVLYYIFHKKRLTRHKDNSVTTSDL